MSQVVQARCPYCRNLLRIPAEWLSQPMRCKHCQQVFQARTKGDGTPAPPSAAPLSAAVPAASSWLEKPAAASPRDPFAFDDPGDAVALPRSRRRQPARWWIGGLIVLSVLGVGATVFVVAYDDIARLFGGGSANANAQDKEDKDRPQALADQARRDDKAPGDKPSTDRPNTDRPRLDGPSVDGNRDNAPRDNSARDQGPADKKIAKPPVVRDGPFPRRALFINVCNYLYANPVYYGSAADPAEFRKTERWYPGSSTRALKFLMEYSPMNVPSSQIYEITDGQHDSFTPPQKKKGPMAPATIAPFKPNIENAITEFVNTSRAQDRIMILFAGHAMDIDKESYLVPLEGEMSDAKSLIPLSWVYDQLARCKAQEKVLIVDVCRFPPDRGFELPGGGEPGSGKMTEQLDEALQKPLPGVQVWCSCVKEQNSIELERGSVFLRALCAVLQETPRPITEAPQALPLQAMVGKVNKYMKKVLDDEKLEQVSRLSGAPGKDGGYDPEEALPPALSFKPVLPGGLSGPALQLAKEIKDEIDLIPPARKTRQPPDFLPPMPAKTLAFYQKDYKNLGELKDAKKYPVRAAVLKAIDVLRENDRITVVERLAGGGGPVSKQTKDKFLRDQQGPGKTIFILEGVLNELLKAGEKLEEEPAKRWQAHYHYTLAKFQSRLVYLYEYNFILAQVRGDNLPEINPAIHNGWRIGSRPKVSITEGRVKDMAKTIGRTWKSIIEDYPDTPWAVLAKRERLTALGLEWRPSRD